MARRSPHDTRPPLAISPFGTPHSGNANHIKLYDARNFDTGPFETFPLGHAEVADFLAAHMNTTLASEQTQVDGVGWGRGSGGPRHLSDPRQLSTDQITHHSSPDIAYAPRPSAAHTAGARARCMDWNEVLAGW